MFMFTIRFDINNKNLVFVKEFFFLINTKAFVD